MAKNSIRLNNMSEEEINKNTPLSDEELSRLIQASRDDTFKAKAIKNKTEEDFKKVSLHDIAKKYNQQAELKEEAESSKEKAESSKEEAESSKEEGIKEENIKNNDTKSNIKEDKDNIIKKNDDNKLDANHKENDIEPEEFDTDTKIQVSNKIDETQHMKILENAKKKAFEKGKAAALLEIKEGSDAAIARLTSISEKISKTENLDLIELENLISNKILSLSSELTGKIIKAIPTEFLKKIQSFVASLDNNDGKIQICISEDDYKILEKNKDIKSKLKEMNFTSNTDLGNGEVILLVNGIRIKQTLES